MIQKRYLIKPYGVGKEKRSLAMILPSQVVKELEFDPSTMLLSLQVKGLNDLHLKITREENFIKKDTERLIPAEKFPTLSKQVSVAIVGED